MYHFVYVQIYHTHTHKMEWVAPRAYAFVILADIAKGSLLDVIPCSKSMIHDIRLTWDLWGFAPGGRMPTISLYFLSLEEICILERSLAAGWRMELKS